MKKLTIGTKAQADRVLVESLFKPVNGKTLNVSKYCTGKYKAETSFIGREVEVYDGVHALYMTRGKDKDGPYQTIMCICEDQ